MNMHNVHKKMAVVTKSSKELTAKVSEIQSSPEISVFTGVVKLGMNTRHLKQAFKIKAAQNTHLKHRLTSMKQEHVH